MESEFSISRYVFEPVNSNMYIIICKQEAIIIDPNISEEAMIELMNKNVKQATILLTHEHYDHTTGVTWFEERIKCKLICHEKCAERVCNKKNNRPLVISAQLMGGKKKIDIHSLPQAYICKADEKFIDIFEQNWYDHTIRLISTPGHTDGSCCIEFADQYVFTGDSLIKDTKVITPYPTGSIEKYHSITLPYLRNISGEYIIMPGHGESFVRQEIEL